MTLINSLPELIKNTLYLESKLSSTDALEQEKAIDLIRRGTCFLRYTVNNKVYFAPSRFIGYKDNTISAHIKSRPHGSITNNRINNLLGHEPSFNRKLEIEYNEFCAAYGFNANATGNFGRQRKFWDLDGFSTNVYGDIELPEGKIKYVKHVLRERNPRVRQIAINIFLSRHKKLYCEACKFDFHKKYGNIGKDFIECHHSIPISKMPAGHKTRPEDIVLLCSNCHRIIHKGKKWLTLEQLQDILKKQKGYR